MSAFREESIPSIQDAVKYFYGNFPDGKIVLSITKDEYMVTVFKEKDDITGPLSAEDKDTPISITICGLTQQLADSLTA